MSKPNWYTRLHAYLVKNYGNATKCQNQDCKSLPNRRYEWALKKGRAYSENIDDYLELCPSCHRKYDYKPEIGAKISKALKGRIIPDTIRKKMGKGSCNRKRVKQLSMNGRLIKEHSSVSNAARAIGAKATGAIWNHLSGKTTHAGGFKWEYV